MNRLSTFFVISALTLTGVASVGTGTAQAQTFTVIHAFTGQDDGYQPDAGLTLDRAGNLYGTTTEGRGPGTVFQLKRPNGNWILNTLYGFEVNIYDARSPEARVVFGPDGTLYGFTPVGGSGHSLGGVGGCGTVYNLRPPAAVCKTAVCPWTETVLYSFTGGADGRHPYEVDPVFDQVGNLYGTTYQGGSSNYGVVFKLTPSGEGWTESVIHDFTGGDDGRTPASGMIFDSAGNLYGTTQGGVYGVGTVFRLAHSGSGWVLSTLYSFQGGADGQFPGPLIFDRSGNLYGAATDGGPGGGGTVFELMPSGGSWTFDLLYDWGPGVGPEGNLAMDAVGNLYGAAVGHGAFGMGTVFKLTPLNGGWIYTDLYDFTGLDDGDAPIGGVTLDANGNVYGTTLHGGPQEGENCILYGGCGVVWEITP